MNKYIFYLITLCICASFLVACSGNDEESDASTEQEEKASSANDEEEKEETKEEEDKDKEEDNSINKDEEQKIEGNVIVDQDEAKLKVEAESNLLENTQVDAMLRKAYGEIDANTSQFEWESTEVDSEGNIILDYPLDEEFFDKFHGEDFEFMINIESSQAYDHLAEAYGENGENFSGPFAYRNSDSAEEGKKLRAPTYIRVGDEQTDYEIETPDRIEKPDDYGDTDVWMEAEVVDNDHRFLYIEGESNLLEGTLLSGKYYSDEDTTFYDGFRTEKYVEPDGTFSLPIKYDSITQDGYIEIHSIPNSTHRTVDDILEAYGENFENLSGGIVVDEDDHQEILLKIDTEGNEMETPEDSFVTENDGEVKIQVPDDVLFDFDKSALKSDSKATLNEVIDVLEDVEDGIAIEINGHTDNEGETEYNLKLSEERAEEVEKYLAKNGDIDHLSIQTNGYGEKEPIESNAEEEGRERNRRVEIVIETLE